MLVGEQFRRTVVFLSQPEPDGNHLPKGTAFIVVPEEEAEAGHPYLVTARHVVEAARATGRSLYIRGNDADGGFAIRELPDYDAWHISAETDVAIFSAPPLDGIDVVCVPTSAFALPGFLDEHRIGPGDEVFFVGLFTGHPGSENNEPIVRFGNISMLPHEPVDIRNADGTESPVNAFLVEARSWGGQSGSPAFVWISPIREPGVMRIPAWSGDPGSGGVMAPKEAPHLLGLVCGHFELPRDITFREDEIGSDKLRQNAGVAIVIPAEDIARELAEASSAG